jgi:hypothetical protein
LVLAFASTGKRAALASLLWAVREEANVCRLTLRKS